MKILLSNIVVTASTFLAGVLLARGLGVEDRGAFAAFTVWAHAIANIALLGTHIHLARVAGQNSLAVRIVYARMWQLITGLAVVGAVSYVVIQYFYVSAPLDLSWLSIGLGMLIIPGSMVNAAQIQIELGRRSYGNSNFARRCFALVFLILSLAIFLLSLSSLVYFLIAILIATYAGNFLTGIRITKGLAAEVPIRVDQLSIGHIIKGSKGFALTALAAGLAIQADKLLLSGLFPAAALGVYVVASSIAQVQNTLGEAFAQPFFANMTGCTSEDTVDREGLARSLRQIAIVSLLSCLMAMIVFPKIIVSLYGADFAPAASLLAILLPAVAIRVATRPHEEILRGLGRAVFAFFILGSAVVVMMIGILFAAYYNSLTLVAWAVLAGNFAGLTVALLLTRNIFGISLVDLAVPRLSDASNIASRFLFIFTRP